MYSPMILPIHALTSTVVEQLPMMSRHGWIMTHQLHIHAMYQILFYQIIKNSHNLAEVLKFEWHCKMHHDISASLHFLLMLTRPLNYESVVWTISSRHYFIWNYIKKYQLLQTQTQRCFISRNIEHRSISTWCWDPHWFIYSNAIEFI